MPVTVETFINASLEIVWEVWTNAEHIVQWNRISGQWHTPMAKNDLREGGQLFLRMELKDGSDGFDYKCYYDEVVFLQKISHTGTDKRKTTILFFAYDNGVRLTETFDPEDKTPIAVQRAFCQSILYHFKAYVENLPSGPAYGKQA